MFHEPNTSSFPAHSRHFRGTNRPAGKRSSAGVDQARVRSTNVWKRSGPTTSTGRITDRRETMRVMVFVKATKNSEAGLMPGDPGAPRSEEHTSELQSQSNLVCRLLLEKKK